MIAVQLSVVDGVFVDLLLWARWVVLEGRLAPACSMGQMGHPFGTVDVTSCGRLPARAWMRRDGVMGHMGHLGDPFLIAP